MKSIVYILIAVFISSILISAIPSTNSEQNQHVKIQCADPNYNEALFNESCSIINSRLDDFGVADFELSVNHKQKCLTVTFGNNVDLTEVLPLLLSKGKLEFYETFDRLDVIKLLTADDELFSLMNIPLEDAEIDNTTAIMGFCKENNKELVEMYINEHYVSKPGHGIRFTWSMSTNSNDDNSLFLLKHNSSMNKANISNTAVHNDAVSNNNTLMIAFDKHGEKEWLKLTENNIGKSIAIVLDNKVYYAPKVMSRIKDGSCLISGAFSVNEIVRLNTLIINKELPLTLTQIE